MTRVSMRLTAFAIVAGLLLLFVAAPKVFNATQAWAQSAPPDLPLVLYGTANGQATGAGVVAIVDNAGKGKTCGSGLIKNEGGQKVYAVQVAADSQIAGCGKAGRTISIYVSGGSTFTGAGGKIATQVINWTSGQTSENNLTFGPALTVRGFVTLATSDGIN
jgi:hypothetical protein